MQFDRFICCLIFPFDFDRAAFLKVSSGELVNGNDFKIKKLRQDILSEYGIYLLAAEERTQMVCMEADCGARMKMGLQKRAGGFYCLKAGRGENRREYRFSIPKIFLWFLESGKGFLTLTVSAEDISGGQVLDFKNALVHVNETGISYELKNEAIPCHLRIRDIPGRMSFLPEAVRLVFPKNLSTEVYSLTLGQAAGVNADAIPFFMEKLRGSRKSNEGITAVSDENVLYRPYEYIYWAVSRSSMDAVVDLDCADHTGNGEFVRSGLMDSVIGGMSGASLPGGYLMLYLYYLSLQRQYKEKADAVRREEERMRPEEGRQDISGLRRQAEDEIINIERCPHVQKLFSEYLLRNTYNLYELLEKLDKDLQGFAEKKEMKYDNFISYRRKYGGYIAKLIFDALKRRGERTFFDVHSMRQGEYPAQIRKAISQSEYVIVILTPGCLEECVEDQEDWMRYEIAYALNQKKKIVTVMADEFKFPKELPEDIENIPRIQGIELDIKKVTLDPEFEELKNYLE